MYGGDAAGQSVANSIGAKASFAVAARNAEDGISYQSAESLLLEMAALTRLRE